MDALIAYLGGVGVLALVGHFAVPAVLEKAAQEPSRPSAVDENAWTRLTKGADGGSWIGFFERTLFFVGFASGKEELVAAWLAFKLASKWEVWKNVIRVPDPPPGPEGLSWLVWTHDFGSWILQRFWVGVLANVLLSFVAAMGARMLYHALR